MILSQTISCASKFGETKSIEMIAKAGFDAIDYSMSPMKSDACVLNSDECKRYVLELCETAKETMSTLTKDML